MHLKSLAKALLYAIYDLRLLRRLRSGPFPKHLGVILDGNRRFAKLAGLSTVEGHRLGAEKTRQLLRWCHEFKIPVVTVWGFSTHNFSRDPKEVKALMDLFIAEARSMKTDEDFVNNDVRVRILGRIDEFPEELRTALKDLEDSSAHRKGMLVQLALAYGGREEILDAVKSYLHDKVQTSASLADAIEQLTEDEFSKHLYNGGVPDPDFIIRTSGEIRLSGFLLWQSAYSEYYFIDVNWPGFRRVDFLRALRSFQLRQRRFGK